jgi:endonuclease YncB( thermonuclease family)
VLSRQLLALGLLSGMVMAGAPGRAAVGTVLSIGDGDTITLNEGSQRIRVRLACIDAPETSQAPYGMAARRSLQLLLPLGSEVSFRPKATDRYGRTVAEIYKGTTNINQTLVRSGDAFVYWQYINGCDRQTYSRLENDAHLQVLGVWSEPGGIQRPWEYRHGSRGHGHASASARSDAHLVANGRRYTCTEIGSWAKAQELLKLGHTYLDRDGDGNACESLK